MKNPNQIRKKNDNPAAPAAQERRVAPSTEEPSEMAQIMANQVLERALTQKDLGNIVGDLCGLRELLLPHPGFRKLCAAIEAIADGNCVLNEFNRKVAGI